ncbi:GFA family protein [Pseudoroseicyclus aestuarii]|uniref:CENP-V/GFA domain-containing protein n=1 Tax=Pseudoroseicyclus aestuarii TaxID=1795041 RepID=A0A318SRT2_9RHOB|nr:GFA family protein [Pseudoroseicyclus aestuarii]PYE84393.1 hypothetical protein DFP88_102191 [Pseudoroseicyclus aestuarii]
MSGALGPARSGGCLCGSVRFTAQGADEQFNACHCRMCQRWVGGPFMAVSVPAEGLAVTGDWHIGTYQSSCWAERAFCRQCGSALWYRVTDPGKRERDVFEVLLGLFDDPSGIAMTGEIFIDRKPEAYALHGDHPRRTEAEILALYAPAEGATA